MGAEDTAIPWPPFEDVWRSIGRGVLASELQARFCRINPFCEVEIGTNLSLHMGGYQFAQKGHERHRVALLNGRF